MGIIASKHEPEIKFKVKPFAKIPQNEIEELITKRGTIHFKLASDELTGVPYIDLGKLLEKALKCIDFDMGVRDKIGSIIMVGASFRLCEYAVATYVSVDNLMITFIR